MSRFTFDLPDIGEGIAEAEIVGWHVKVGDMIEEDDQIADMMTDKATVEMESPVSGKVIEVAGEIGDVIAIGSMLVVIEIEGEVDQAEEPSPFQERGAGEKTARQTLEDLPPEPDIHQSPTFSPSEEREKKVLASPAVRKRAKGLGIVLSEIHPAADGRVRHADLDAFLSYNSAKGFAPAGSPGKDVEIKVIGLRRRIAENMQAAKRHIPHFTYVEECDVTELERMRAQLNEGRGDKPKLTMMPLLIAAICRTIPQFPMINARYDDEANIVTRHGAVHLGIAVQTENGLIVPVIRDAQERNLWQLAREITRLADAAKDGTARSSELSGSTLTLTSLGRLGGVVTTPVINRPEVAIIGPNRIVEKPMFVPVGSDENGRGERIEKRKLMNMSISCDHRVVDGHDAASFVQDIKKLLEKPVMLLVD